MCHSLTVSCSPSRAGAFATDAQRIKHTGSPGGLGEGCPLRKLLPRLFRQAGRTDEEREPDEQVWPPGWCGG